MQTTYLVLDIETIPDLTLWTPPEPEIEKISIDKKPTKDSVNFLDVVMERIGDQPIHPADVEKAYDIARRLGDTNKLDRLEKFLTKPEPEKTPFAPIHTHKPVAIGCVWLDSNFHAKKVGCLKLDKSERDLLLQWNGFMAEHQPTVVSWYGRGFDLPVLMLRSLKCGIQMPWYFGDRDYRYRYSENKHADLCDSMGDFGATRGLKLDSVAQLIGLPGKHDDTDGSQVAAMFEAGKLEEIATYCLDDTLQTAFIFQRWQYLKARITLETYRSAVQSLLDSFSQMENMASLRDLIDKPELLLSSIAGEAS